MTAWWQDAFFYHIYPFGFCGVPAQNPAPGAPAAGNGADHLSMIGDVLDEIAATGCNALYLGPVLESTSHGYDTADYYRVDRRLGDEAALRRLVDRVHAAGMRIILDGVFHHVGRDFWAFRTLKEEGESSHYRSWFRDVDFGADNRFGDGFVYHAWEGHEELVALDLENPEVVDHILGAVEWMMRELGIDGLRLDVAYLLEPSFMQALRSRTDSLSHELGREEGFWLMGEAIHGDYTELVAPDRLHSATNYECYKGLWSSHNDRNYFEIAHSLSRQFAAGGIYEGMVLYNFADNHDVDRVASVLSDGNHVFPLYALLMTMPGIPSVYYGSEYGATGSRHGGSDRELRPAWSEIDRSDTRIRDVLAELQAIRARCETLRVGGYRQLYVDHTTLAFARTSETDTVVVVVNAAGKPARVELERSARLVSFFDDTRTVESTDGRVGIDVPAYGFDVLRET
jgi:glycosidase